MDEQTSALEEARIGEIFTPLEWSKWLIKKWNIFDRWIDGETVCDPTAGQGVFIISLFTEAKERGISITSELLARLCLIEIRQENLDRFRMTVEKNFGFSPPSSMTLCLDVITETPQKTFDILVGNPPWANFTNLSSHYKELLKPYFVGAGLVPDRKAVLLGSSRTDIAALVLKVSIGQLLAENGSAHFFVPLSLFTGDDAHIGFRDYKAYGADFCVEEVYEFNKTKVFDGIGTSYCCITIRKGKKQVFPAPYFRESLSGWLENHALPLSKSSDQWRVIAKGEKTTVAIKIHLTSEQKPRQGVNTCGANDIFIFDHFPVFLPPEFIYPLATKEVWKNRSLQPSKWIFLPYDTVTARPLTEQELRSISDIKKYLEKYQERLKNRKGTLIQNSINKGLWWSLLGVGSYSFAPYKVIWEAYGRNNFDPIILEDVERKQWQGNQAMQAFIPCWNSLEAERIAHDLRNPNILLLLKQMNGEGKCNWAQPGKIKKILSFDTGVAASIP